MFGGSCFEQTLKVWKEGAETSPKRLAKRVARPASSSIQGARLRGLICIHSATLFRHEKS
jgi:hypothetical protein